MMRPAVVTSFKGKKTGMIPYVSKHVYREVNEKKVLVKKWVPV